MQPSIRTFVGTVLFPRIYGSTISPSGQCNPTFVLQWGTEGLKRVYSYLGQLELDLERSPLFGHSASTVYKQLQQTYKITCNKNGPFRGILTQNRLCLAQVGMLYKNTLKQQIYFNPGSICRISRSQFVCPEPGSGFKPQFRELTALNTSSSSLGEIGDKKRQKTGYLLIFMRQWEK